MRHPGARGWLGRGRGEMGYVQAAEEWRGTTVQVCGLWPFAPGVGLPMVGVPLGRHIYTGATLCADPISWFQANIISNPSAYLLGLPGLGKARRCAGSRPAWPPTASSRSSSATSSPTTST